MDKIPIKKVANELGVNKDYALRLVKKLGEQLGIKPIYGRRKAVYLSRADADCLIKNYEPRKSRAALTNDDKRIEGFGYFYIIQLHPKDLPNRLKIGYTDNIDIRLSDHRTTAPTLKLVKAWPCKRLWEDAARASITRSDFTHVGGEVYDADVQVFVDRAEAFFSLMPVPSLSHSSSAEDS